MTEFPNENFPHAFGKHYLMALEHRKTILRCLPPDGRMLEYGSGSSTLWFQENLQGSQELISIESDKKFARKTGAIWANVETGGNASIAEEHVTVSCYRYVWEPIKYGNFDVILVDGVFRNLCLLAARCFLNPGGVVFLHDANRNWYEAGKALYQNSAMHESHPDYKGILLWEGKNPL